MNGLYWLSRILVGSGKDRVEALVCAMQLFRSRSLRRLAALMSWYLQRSCGVFISPNAVIGSNVQFPHPIGIVIDDGVEVGDNCTIFQGVTIGGARIGDAQKRLYPKIQEGVVLFAGAVIVGEIVIGAGATVGANAFVNKDVPPNSIAVGMPVSVRGRRLE